MQYVALDRRAGARRSRLFLRLGEAGARRRSRRASRSPPSSPGLALAFSILFGVPLGVHQRGAAEHAARLRVARGQPERAVDAVVLARPADPDGVRRTISARSRSTPTRRSDSGTTLCALQRAGGGGRLPLLGAGDAADALLDAGSAAAGLHPHRARQGRLRRATSIPSRAAQRAAAGRHRHRHRGGVPDGRADRHRDGVQHSRASRASWSRRSAGATIRSCRTW